MVKRSNLSGTSPLGRFLNLILIFLNGFALCMILNLHINASYEERLFRSVKESVDCQLDADDTPDSAVVKAMHTCYRLMHDRAAFFSDATKWGDGIGFIRPAWVDFMTTCGSCGSYAIVLARVLKEYKHVVRIAQMRVNGVSGGHIVVEVNTGAYWVVLDPAFDCFFIRPDNRLASFADVSRNWGYYSTQTPGGYDMRYRYEGVRYTNWTKIPILLPLARIFLRLFLGQEKTDQISLRTWFLNIYNVYFCLALSCYLFLLALTLKLKYMPPKNRRTVFALIRPGRK
jgi:hypothetical protein